MFTKKLKSLFLLVIISAFCYRAAHLEQKISEEQLSDYTFHAFLMLLCQDLTLNNATAHHAAPPASAANKEHVAEKLNTLIEGYADTVARQSEKAYPDEKVLTKIEREIAIIELAAQKNDVQNLLKNETILKIKQAITLLRMPQCNKREKANKI